MIKLLQALPHINDGNNKHWTLLFCGLDGAGLRLDNETARITQ